MHHVRIIASIEMTQKIKFFFSFVVIDDEQNQKLGVKNSLHGCYEKMLSLFVSKKADGEIE